MSSRTAGIIALFLVIFGTAGRLAYLKTGPLVAYYNSLSDTGLNHTWATQLPGRGDDVAMASKGIVYPAFLSVVYRLVGPRPQNGLMVQILLDALSIFLIFKIGRRFFTPGAGLIGAASYAFSGPAVFYANLLVVETTLGLLIIAGVGLVMAALRDNRSWLAGLGGLAWGLAALGRGNVLFAALLAVIVCLAGKRTLLSLFLTVGVLMPVVANGVRNRLVHQDWIFTQATSGLNLYIGNNARATGYYVVPGGIDLTTDFAGVAAASRARGRSFRPSEASSFYAGRVWEFVQHNPGRALALGLAKFLYLWNNYELPQFENYYYARRDSVVLKGLPVTFAFFIILGCAGLVATTNLNYRALPAGVVIGYLVSLVPFFVVGRFRHPVAPLLALLSGCGVVWLAREIRERTRLRFVLAAMMAGLAGLAFMPLVNRARFDIQARADHGLWHMYEGRFEPAYRELDSLVKENPDQAVGYNGLGQVVMRRGSVTRAAELFRQAVRLEEAEGAYHINLGGAYYVLGKVDSALGEFELGARLAPLNVRVESFRAWALELRRLGQIDSVGFYVTVARNLAVFRDYPTALLFLKQASRIQPDSKEVQAGLRSVYHQLGDWPGLRAVLYQCLRSQPDNRSVLRDLGFVYFEIGAVDSARRYLARYLEQAPLDTAARSRFDALNRGP